MPNQKKKYLKQMALSLCILLVGEGLMLIVIILTPVLWLSIILACLSCMMRFPAIAALYCSIDDYLSYKPTVESDTAVLAAAPAPADSMNNEYELLIILYKKESLINDQKTRLMASTSTTRLPDRIEYTD